jgi:hypothetical protein
MKPMLRPRKHGQPQDLQCDRIVDRTPYLGRTPALAIMVLKLLFLQRTLDHAEVLELPWIARVIVCALRCRKPSTGVNAGR